ncbi:MAG: hypothetical protein OCC49_06715 [Fibrobacterales bacterium]
MKIVAVVLLGVITLFSAEVSFKNPDIKTRYSKKLQERINSGDELLQEFNGDGEFEALLQAHPELWVITNLKDSIELATSLKLDLVYIDGINEESMCTIRRPESIDTRMVWDVELGVDFISGGASIIPEHIKICFEKIKSEVGYAYYNDKKEIVKVLPEQIANDLEVYRVAGDIAEDLQLKVLAIQKEFITTTKCPQNIESYLVLMDIYEQVDTLIQDIFQAENDLSVVKNGGKKVTACAFSKQWNEQYSEDFDVTCNITDNSCIITQSEDGRREWVMNFDQNTFEFQGESILFIPIGDQSIHDGGQVMDLRLIPLSQNLYIEAYLSKDKKPVSLGLLTIEK